MYGLFFGSRMVSAWFLYGSRMVFYTVPVWFLYVSCTVSKEKARNGCASSALCKRKEIKEKVAFDECAPSNSDDFRDFLDYWFEHGTNDKKMRFEKERSFSWSRRWKLWLRNKEKWKKEKSFAKIEKDRRPAYEIIQQVKNGTYGIDN